MEKTKIEWATHSWNPVTGCTPISEGCENCYARRMAKRLAGRCGYPAADPFRVTIHPERLDELFRWKKPRRVFVCSMSDLFHEDVPYEFIYDIWDVMVKNRQHTFLILSKRPDRMKNFIERVMANRMDYAYMLGNTPEGKEAKKWAQRPIQNIWLGVTAENQEQADKRIPILLQIPAVVRFVSVEPMLGLVDLLSNDYLGGCINCEVCLDNPKTCINRAQDRKDVEMQWRSRERGNICQVAWDAWPREKRRTKPACDGRV